MKIRLLHLAQKKAAHLRGFLIGVEESLG